MSNIIKQFSIVLAILYCGEILSYLIRDYFIFPGSIIGMIILFLLLQKKLLKLSDIETVANFFLGSITLFFIPAGLSLVNYLPIIKENLLAILIAGILVTALAMGITMKSVDFLIAFKERGDADVN